LSLFGEDGLRGIVRGDRLRARARDSGVLIGVHRRQGAEEQAVNVGEDGGAARGDAVLREEAVEVDEKRVNALRGLVAAGTFREGRGEIRGGLLPVFGVMLGAKAGVGVGSEQTALPARRGAMLTACGFVDGNGFIRLRNHDLTSEF
jgi:hypothetical protein